MDDLFMQVCFENNLVCVQLILRIILKKPDLTVLSVRTQHPLHSLQETRSLCLDVFAQDSQGRLYNLEIQRKDVAPERGRLHSALLDASALKAGETFSRLPEAYVIFIMERDPFKQGLPLYHFVRAIPETGLLLEDGSHIVYVNGELREEMTELSQLMHDFFCTEADEMYFEALAQVVRHFKGSSEGVQKMSSVVEEIREEGRAEGVREANLATALQMLKMGRFTLEDIAAITRLNLDEIREIAEKNAR